MSWAWTRTFYSLMNGQIYNFETKKQRDEACKEIDGREKYSACEAYKNYSNVIRVGFHDFDNWLKQRLEEGS